MNQVDQLFVETTEGFRLNADLKLQFDGEQAAAQYLVEVIRFWHGKVQFFCQESTSGSLTTDDKRIEVVLPEAEWVFTYKMPTYSCFYCRRAGQLLDKIFGDGEKFGALPFVFHRSDRSHLFHFDLLTYFAKHGQEDTVSLLKLRAQKEEKRERLDKERAWDKEEHELQDKLRLLEQKRSVWRDEWQRHPL